jgi:DMSO/TMAO reductase YedYZ molybdopterin-dependent catalytic subunit
MPARSGGAADVRGADRDAPDGELPEREDGGSSGRSIPGAALAGLLAAALAVGVGELAAGLVPDARSLVIVVGDAVIDLVPSAVKEFAIAVFGTNDKIALIAGIGLVLAMFGALLGVLARRRFLLGTVGVVLLGVIGIAAVLVQRPPSLLPAAAPSVAAVLAGVGGLRLLFRRRGPATGGAASPGMNRRAFLRASAVVAVAAVGAGGTGRWLQQRASAVASRAGVLLRGADRPQPPVPATVEVGVEGVTPFVTSNDSFYRIDTALEVPQIQVDGWQLRVHGMVDSPLELRFADLLDRTLVEADITLTCVSNEIGGGLIGNARWLGVPLADVLADAGVQPGATQVVGRSVDNYTCGFPVEAALDGRGALIAVGMNGEPLPLEHGFPARLIVPGLYGYVSATKWLTEIELTTFEAFDHYWVSRGWAVEAPIKTQSRIDVPRAFAELAAGRVTVAGVAWAQTRGIDRVEIQVDDGSWQEARLAEPLNDVTWRQWAYDWDATPGLHQIRVRATDGTGATQPEQRVAPIPDGATGWHQITARVA